MRSWANSLAALLILIAAPAAATPPQIVDIRDTLFARDADTLLILREVTDNHGSHTILQTDTLLVFRSLTDGADRGFRGVERVIERFEGAPRVEYLPLASPENPYAMRASGFWPLRAPANPRHTARLSKAGLTLPGYALAADALAAHIEDTLQATRSILPIHFMEGGVDPFDPTAFDPLAECTPGPAMALNDAPADPALVQLSCTDDETGQQAILWVVVPASGG